jgi:hypothetical protein
MAQEGIATLPQSPENQAPIGQKMPFSGELENIKATLAKDNPEAIPAYEEGMQSVVQQLNLPIEDLQALMEGLQYILANEQNYPQIRAQLISSGVLDEEDLPPEFDRGYFTTMMVMTQEAINRKQQPSMSQMPEPQGFQKGGLAGAAEALRRKGRGGDTILAHINPQEARMLKSMGGSGTINPATGLLEFKGGPIGAIGDAIGGAFKAVGDAAKAIVSSPIGRIVATVALTAALGPAGLALTSSTAFAAGIAGTAVSLAGGSNLKEALISGVTSGAMAGFAPQISSMLPGAGGYLNAAATGAIMGAGYGALTGQNIGQAALTGGVLAGGMSAFGGANATDPGTGTGLFSPSEPRPDAPITDNSQILNADGTRAPLSGGAVSPSSQGISTLASGNTNLTAPTDAVGGYGPDTGFVSTSNQVGGYGSDTGFTPTTAQTRGSELIPGNVNTEVTYTDKRLPLPNARDVESQAGGFYGGRAPTAEEYMVTQQGMPRSVTQSDSTGIGGFYDKAKDYLFSSDPSNPGFFYNSKGDISIPAVTGTVLAGGALMGGFTPTQPAPPGIVDRNVTGETLVNRDPSRYIVGGIPGYNAPQPTVPPVGYTPSPQYGRSAVPTYTPPPGTTTATNYQPIQQPYNNPYNYSFMPRVYAAKGGITSIYPRKTGKIDGPGTGTSDSIPAMLSDGEFVLTAKAVKGAGKGSRREGAKKLYRMMHALEKKAGGRV